VEKMQNKSIIQKVGIRSAATGAAIAGLVPLVLALGGCTKAASRGIRLTLGEVEYGAKTTSSEDPDIQREVIRSNAKYEDTVRTSPGYGIRYKQE